MGKLTAAQGEKAAAGFASTGVPDGWSHAYVTGTPLTSGPGSPVMSPLDYIVDRSALHQQDYFRNIDPYRKAPHVRKLHEKE